MKEATHTDLMAFYGGNLQDVYDHLVRDQERDIFTYKMAFWCLLGFSGLTCVGITYHWSSTILFAFAVVISLERSIWWGRELSTRNHLMHVVAIEKARKAT